MKFIQLVILSLICFTLTAQSYTMQSTTVSDCNATFTDSNSGPNGEYTHNENYTFTICPNGADSILMDFTSFCTEINLDVLRFFDGPDTLSPLIGIPFSGNASLPPQIIATSGCLTIHFKSDASVFCTGWEASWQTIINTPANPIFDTISTQACNTTNVTFTLDQQIICSSLSIANINIFGPVGQTVTNITAIACVGNTTNTIQIDFFPGTNQNGTYQIILNADFIDACGNVWPLTAFGSFTVDACPISAEIVADDINDTICLGECVNLQANAWDGDGNYNYSWTNGLAANAGPHNVCPVLTTTYQVTVTDGTTAPAGVANKTIYVIQPVIMPNDTTVCQTTAVFDLDASPNIGFWSGPCFGNDTLQGIFHPFWCGTGIKTVTFNYYGCQSTMDITINPNNIWASNYLVCPGSPSFNFSTNNPGGIYAGIGITDTIAGTFDPVISGVGSFQITYTNAPCPDITRWITVGTVNMPSNDTICSNDGLYEPAISPHGGVWSYPANPAAVTNWYWCRFDPLTAGAGTHNILYTTGTCVDTFKLTIFDVEAGNNLLKCVSNPPFNLTGFSPPGGIWSGMGITDATNGTFDPGANGGNDFDPWVKYTINGCSDSLKIYVRNTRININPLASFCDNDADFTLNYANTGRTPWSGTWSGIGVTNTSQNGTFSPSVAGVGTHTLYYEVNTCPDSTQITVYQNAELSDTTVCTAELIFNIPTIIPGGTWSGNGIVNPIAGSFLASQAGAGVHVINYTTLDGCSYSMNITVTNLPVLTINGLPNTWCLADTNFILNAIPLGGNWTNTTNDTIFNPIQEGTGLFNITYSMGTGACLVSTSASISIDDTLQISPYFTDTIICLGDYVRIGATGNGGNELNYTYSWSNGIGNSSENVIQVDTTTMYIVTLNDGCSQEVFTSSQVNIQTDFQLSFETSGIKCFDETSTAKVIVNPSGLYNYEWNTNPTSNSDNIIGKAGTFYKVTVTDINSCIKEAYIEIPSYEKLIADFTISPNDACVDLLNADFYFIDQSIGATKGNWYFGDGSAIDYATANNITHAYQDTGIYIVYLQVQNDGDCSENITKTICVTLKTLVLAPTAFSPNGDGNNDLFFIHAIGIGFADFTIYDRWGEKVYQTDDVKAGWDGTFKDTKAAMGTYSWQVQFHSLENNNNHLQKGHFQLIR